MKRGLAPLLLLLLTAGIYVGCAATPALIDEADCGHAIASRELLQTGDWAVLHINGIRWLEKPPLMIWITAAFFKLFGVSEFCARAGSALSGVAIVALLQGRSPETPSFAGTCYSTVAEDFAIAVKINIVVGWPLRPVWPA